MAIYLRKYIAQLSKGCDAIACDNEYCKSCPKFKFPNLENNTDIFEKAKELLLSSGEKLICKNLSPIQWDNEYLSKSKFPELSAFQDLSKLNKKEFIDALKDEYMYSYAFFKTPEDQQNLIKNHIS